MPARHREHHSTASAKTITITMEWCSRPPGIRVHDALETANTMRRNMHLLRRPKFRGRQKMEYAALLTLTDYNRVRMRNLLAPDFG
jgi:phage host-nuclease inhibitor protein Gam